MGLTNYYQIKELTNLRLLFDRDGKFLFFHNTKVLTRSIARNALKNRIICYKHKPILHAEKMEECTLKVLNRLFKFSFVRNPWDRTVSAYFYLSQEHPELLPREYFSFKEFIKTDFKKRGTMINDHFQHQYQKTYNDGHQIVDFIGRFENVEEDWKYVASKIDAESVLPHIGASAHDDYRIYYDDESIEIVRNIYKKDIDLFGYEFKK